MFAMSVIEDTRKVLQDFIAPELRAVDARLAAVEKRLENFERQVDQRFDNAERHVDQRFDQLLAEIRSLNNVHELELRMARYESMLPSNQQKSQPRSESEAA